METKKSFTSKMQMEKLIKMMEKNPNLAKGIYKKTEANKYWVQYSEELNSCGPPVKSPDKWAKVWVDFKSKVKRKMVENKKELNATGGGPNVLHGFSPLEEIVIKLLSLKDCVDPSGEEFGLSEDLFDTGENVDKDAEIRQDQNTSILEAENLENIEINNVSEEPPRKKIRTKKSNQNQKYMIIECIKQQNDFHNDVKKDLSAIKNDIGEIKEFMKKIYYVKEDELKIKKEKLIIYKDETEKKQKDRIAKLELLELAKKEKLTSETE